VTAAIQEASLRGQIAATEKIIADEDKQRSLLQKQLDAGAVAKTALLAQETTLAQTRRRCRRLKNSCPLYAPVVGAGRTDADNEPAAVFELASLKLPQKLPLSVPPS